MKIVTGTVTMAEIRKMAEATFGNMVKAVVDTDKELVALDAELHSDLEALLLDNGSRQRDIWGINLYPDLPDADFVEFDSLINIRPSHGNRSRGVENEETRRKILSIVSKRIKR